MALFQTLEDSESQSQKEQEDKVKGNRPEKGYGLASDPQPDNKQRKFIWGAFGHSIQWLGNWGTEKKH